MKNKDYKLIISNIPCKKCKNIGKLVIKKVKYGEIRKYICEKCYLEVKEIQKFKRISRMILKEKNNERNKI